MVELGFMFCGKRSKFITFEMVSRIRRATALKIRNLRKLTFYVQKSHGGTISQTSDLLHRFF